MKSEAAIRRRLDRLRDRYRLRYVKEGTARLPQNCRHNRLHEPVKLPYQGAVTELELAPRQVTTLVVIQPESPVRLCMYGSDDPSAWTGDLCETAERSRGCRWFEAKQDPKELAEGFDALMADDSHVLNAYPDVAALQWAIGERNPSPSLISRLLRALTVRFFRPERTPALLPPASDEDLSKLWNDDPPPNS